ncbi:MAG TPA: hypothetical protein VFG84_02775 [Gemmatimonadaceae bacterium]|nr:hypothetical protein [Gemmatimonadaceae bacterium]
MYTACLFCNDALGRNDLVASCPTGRRLAFDERLGRLWVICPHCGRWNLTPLEERWEAIEECERLFRGTRLRVSTGNIGLATIRNVDLVRIGDALRPEIAAWRYGNTLLSRHGLARRLGDVMVRAGTRVVRDAIGRVAPRQRPDFLDDEALVRLRLRRHRNAIVTIATSDSGARVLLRHGHLAHAALMRPEAGSPWRLRVRHDDGVALLSGDSALHSAARVLAALNAHGGSAAEVDAAAAKLDDAENPEAYFSRISALAMRTRWGRLPAAFECAPAGWGGGSLSERLALQVTNRSFWARGGIGSEPSSLLLRVPLVDRLALEMAANEDAERRSMEGELTALRAAWEEAEEIAAIADTLFDSPPRSPGSPGSGLSLMPPPPGATPAG